MPRIIAWILFIFIRHDPGTVACGYKQMVTLYVYAVALPIEFDLRCDNRFPWVSYIRCDQILSSMDARIQVAVFDIYRLRLTGSYQG